MARLDPLPLVAKLRAADAGAVADLAREVAVAGHLARRGAPSVRPATTCDAGPHVRDAYAVTLWTHLVHRSARTSDLVAAADALDEVHRALADLPHPLPSLAGRIAVCGDLIASAGRTPRLAEDDRAYLTGLLARLLSRLDAGHYASVPLHGDAHLGNVLITSDGARWCDLEGAVLGPREWDFACLPERAWCRFAGADRQLLRLLAGLRSICVIAWCSTGDGIAGDGNEAARHHLIALRRRFGSSGTRGHDLPGGAGAISRT